MYPLNRLMELGDRLVAARVRCLEGPVYEYFVCSAAVFGEEAFSDVMPSYGYTVSSSALVNS